MKKKNEHKTSLRCTACIGCLASHIKFHYSSSYVMHIGTVGYLSLCLCTVKNPFILHFHSYFDAIFSNFRG